MAPLVRRWIVDNKVVIASPQASFGGVRFDVNFIRLENRIV